MSPQTKEHAALLRWLILRQTAELNSVEQNDDSDDDNEEETEKYQNSVIQDSGQVANMKDINDRIAELPDLIPVTEDEYRWAGFNGRQNKPADTCYCFWVNGTIAVRSISRWRDQRSLLTRNVIRNADARSTSPCEPSSESKISFRKDTTYHWRLWKGGWRASRYVTYLSKTSLLR